MYTIEEIKEFIENIKKCQKEFEWYRPAKAEIMLCQIFEGMSNDKKEEKEDGS